MPLNPLGPSEITRLKDLLFDTVRTLEEIQTLREGMKDTLESVSSELQIPASLLKKAANMMHKGDYNKHEEELKELEQILTAAGQK